MHVVQAAQSQRPNNETMQNDQEVSEMSDSSCVLLHELC